MPRFVHGVFECYEMIRREMHGIAEVEDGGGGGCIWCCVHSHDGVAQQQGLVADERF